MSKKLKKIKNWIENNGYKLKMGNVDQVDYNKFEITINPRQTKTNLIFSALHECGHIIVSDKKSYNKNYKILNKGYLDGRHTKGLLYKYKQLREEIQAWEKGFKLSKKLGININKEDYDKYASVCFNTYTK